METILRVAQVLIAVSMIAIILVQRGAGASAGSGFGAGASGTVFGSRGSGTFLTRATGILAASFFALTMAMGVIASRSTQVDPVAPDLGLMSELATGAEVPQLPGLSSDQPADVPVLPAVEAEPELVPDGGDANQEAGEQADGGQ